MIFLSYSLIIYISVFIIVVFFVQYNLSKMKNKFFGLILPFISILYIIIITCICITDGNDGKYIVKTEQGEEYIFNNVDNAYNKFLELAEKEIDVTVSSHNNSFDKKIVIYNIIPIICSMIVNIFIYIYVRRKLNNSKK